MLPINQVLQGDCTRVLRTLPNGFPAGGLAVLDFDAAAAAWKLREFLVA